tara:strand:+ start:65 stop:316 length:252 start_codon:yes stop_codon:yes gene_type:complete
MKLKKFYLKKYSNDKLGNEINPNATFVGLLDTLYTNHCVYDYICIDDSIIRERLFKELANILNKDYQYIYKLWLNYHSQLKIV